MGYKIERDWVPFKSSLLLEGSTRDLKESGNEFFKALFLSFSQKIESDYQGWSIYGPDRKIKFKKGDEPLIFNYIESDFIAIKDKMMVYLINESEQRIVGHYQLFAYARSENELKIFFKDLKIDSLIKKDQPVTHYN